MACREQMPHLESVHQSRGKDIAVLAVNMGFNDDVGAVRAFRDKHDLHMPVIVDDGRLAAAFDVQVTPLHVLIDRDGRITYVGHSVTDDLERALEALVDTAREPAARPHASPRARAPSEPRASQGSLPAADGRPRVLFFTTSWCEWYLAESRPEMSKECARARTAISAFHNTHAKQAQFSAIFGRVWSGEAAMREYATKHGFRLPLHLDASGALFEKYNIRRVPAVIVIGADGRVEYRMDGHDDTLAESLATALSRMR